METNPPPRSAPTDGPPTVGTRRLAAVMFTDIVGFTAMTQRSEEEALAALEGHRRLVRSILPHHGGVEIKTMGDAFLVEFMSALEAVRCAKEIQDSTAKENSSRAGDGRLFLRIGIHVGDVEHSGGDIFGDAVNIASRIEPLASPGGIAITQQVYDQVRNKTELSFDRVGLQTLKNVEEPVEVFAVKVEAEATHAEASTLPRRRLVVLPFANMTPDRADEYFSDGITEEMISTLSKLGGMDVISRTSAMKYKDVSKSVKEIGGELQVSHVLEGSVRKASNRLRITVQLIEVSRDRHLWAETYEREFDDVFAVQRDIAQNVADSLKLQLFPTDITRLRSGAPENVGAYDLYLQGRYHWGKRTKESLLEAVRLFEAATRIEPGYSLAFVGMADSYSVLCDHLYLPSQVAAPKAKAAALKAIELDPDLAEAHVSLGGVLFLFEWDFPAAERELKRAIELNPNYATAHQWYSLVLCYTGRLGEAKDQALAALKLDPLSPIIFTDLGDISGDMGDLDLAAEMHRRALQLDADFIPSLIGLSTVYSFRGQHDTAEAIAAKLVSLDPGPIGDLQMAFVLARKGRKEESAEVLDRVLLHLDTSFADAADFAAVYCALGDKGKALDWLEKGYRVRSGGLAVIGSDKRFADLSTDPRFVSLLKKMRLRREPSA